VTRWFVIDTLAKQIGHGAPMASASHVTLFSDAEIDLFEALVTAHHWIDWYETKLRRYREMMGETEAPEWLCAPVLYFEYRLRAHWQNRTAAILKFRG